MRILIAEDEPVSAKIILSYVSPLADCVHVWNGEEAFEEFCRALDSDQPFDLVLLDIMMPEVDGQENAGRD